MLFKLTTAFALLASFVSAAPCTGHGDLIINCNVPGAVSLTFDDGPRGVNYERKVAQTIMDQGGKATFFLNGNNYACIYDQENVDQIRWLYENGHVIGSHTWSHADITKLDYNGISQELEKVETALIKILGVKPKYFRPPYGNYNDLAIQVLKDRGYSKVLIWDQATDDAVGASATKQKQVMTDIANSYPAPHLVLQHSVQDTTANTVNPFAAPLLKSKGYKMVTTNKCLTDGEDWPYTYVGPYGTRDSTWHC